MKNISILGLLLATQMLPAQLIAQDKTQREADAFFTKAMALISPEHTHWVLLSAVEMDRKQQRSTDILDLAWTYGKKGGLGELEIHALSFFVLKQAKTLAEDEIYSLGVARLEDRWVKESVRTAFKLLENPPALLTKNQLDSIARLAMPSGNEKSSIQSSKPIFYGDKDELKKNLLSTLAFLEENETTRISRIRQLKERIGSIETYLSALMTRFRNMQQVILQNLK